ncbi:MAG: general stress protein [Defluviitaleaceae bacterium]|nr:general stress protein [Defluviitaleaceae bacterium]
MEKILERIAGIVEKNAIQGGEFTGQICVLSLIDEDGFPTAAVLTPSRANGCRVLTFATLLDGNAAKRAAACGRASVCFASAAHCINLVGEIEVLTSAEARRETWYDALSHHHSGADDPNYGVLKFTTKRCKYFFTDDASEGGFNI